ncbi:MAG: hypothetical protein ACQERC_07560 [Bacteroidota bacterium]
MKLIILYICVAAIFISACSKDCDCTSYTELIVQDNTINPDNTKQLNNYYFQIFQFGVEHELKKLKICNLDKVNAELIGEFNDMHNPQRLSFKVDKNNVDTLFFEINNKGFKFSLNPNFNHYSIYLAENGDVKSVDGHKDEYFIYD